MSIKAKEQKVLVGNKELTVKEMVLSQRDFLFQKLSSYSVSEMLYRGRIAGTEEKISGKNIIEAIQEIVIKLGSKDLTELIINILNTKINREEVLGTDSKDTIPLATTKMESWIRDNMTWKQEPEILKAILEVNDIGGILKNYMEIGGQLSELFQSKKPSPVSPQESAQTPK